MTLVLLDALVASCFTSNFINQAALKLNRDGDLDPQPPVYALLSAIFCPMMAPSFGAWAKLRFHQCFQITKYSHDMQKFFGPRAQRSPRSPFRHSVVQRSRENDSSVKLYLILKNLGSAPNFICIPSPRIPIATTAHSVLSAFESLIHCSKVSRSGCSVLRAEMFAS